MGFTPLEGLMIGTRSGSIDPGILTYLMRTRKLTGEQSMSYSITSQACSVCLAFPATCVRPWYGNQRAKLAFDIYVHRLQAGIAAMAASLAGLDALVFTAGVGENSFEVRSTTCANLRFLGIKLDERKNADAAPGQDIAAVGSAVRVLVVRTQEDWAIARECWRIMRAPAENFR